MRLVWIFVVAATACTLDPVDPDGEFTVTGVAFDLNGESPAGQSVYIYKVDGGIGRNHNVLQYTSLSDSLNAAVVTAVTVDETGSFETTLLGAQVNTEDGNAAAHLVVVYFEQGVPDAFLATASGWHVFTDDEPSWNVGNLQLWNGGAAEQSDDLVTFSWEPAAPAANLPSTVLPSSFFVWQEGSDDLRPCWAGRSFGTSASVPRAAFADTASSGLEWFVTTFSDVGTHEYQHRSRLHDAVSGLGDVEVTDRVVALYAGTPSTPLGSNAATDGDADTLVDLADATTHLFVDIGGQPFDHVLLYSLTVVQLGNAVVRCFACTADEVGADCGAEIGTPFSVDWEPVSSSTPVFVANSGGGTADWIRISVEPESAASTVPTFESVAEIRVVD